MKPIIKAKGISKQYRIGAARALHSSLKEALAESFRSPLKSLTRRNGDSAGKKIWALKDINFEVMPGEIIGIIGRNGAGKSTLLKILSRIVEPTTGRVELYGRIGSLLEVGTGFHPELTGRENIYLNGAILGMKRTEIGRKFDEMVAFAEIENFLDTPVKRYSSGMYMRLAFAVAAHLEPEILLVDEVLAVGDASFQKKCLGKMENVAREGRTVVFISHQMSAIAQLCSKAVFLNQGSIVKEGDTTDVIDHYLRGVSQGSDDSFTAKAHSAKDIFISNARALDSEGKLKSHFTHKEPIVIAITCKINRWISDSIMGFYIRDHRGRKVCTSNNKAWANIEPRSTEILSTVIIPPNFLVPGQYFLTLAVSDILGKPIEWLEDVLTITVIDGGSEFSRYEGRDYGCVFVNCTWNVENILDRSLAGP